MTSFPGQGKPESPAIFQVSEEFGRKIYPLEFKKSLYRNGQILLRRSRGQNLLQDLVHESVHSLDFGPGGLFAGVNPQTMDAEGVFLREYRSFMAEKLVTGNILQGDRHGLIRFIEKNYGAAVPGR